MRLARHFLAALTLCVLAAPAFAQVISSEPVDGFGGVVQATPDLGPSKPGPSTPNAVTVVYDNTASPGIFGVTSTDLASVWGDRLLTTAPGLLSTHVFSVFNSPSSAGNLLTVQVAVDFYDGVSALLIGGYTTNVNFDAGLPIGFYSLVTVPSLDPLLINLPTNVIVLQTVLGKTGAANRLGVVSLDPVTVGSSPTSMYIASSTIGGGVPGFYTFATGPANAGYQVAIAQPPVGTKSNTWGQLKKLYR